MTLTRIPSSATTNRPALPALALAALFLCPAFTSRAQPPAQARPAPEGVERRLSVDDVVQMVLTNNLDILITQYTPALDQFALNGLFSAYDPSFSFNVSRALNSAPGQYYLGYLFPPYFTATDNYSPSLGGALPFGTS